MAFAQSNTGGSQPSSGTTTLNPDDNVALWALIAAAFVTLLNETVMGVALPVLMDELNVTASLGQWLTTAFLLTMAVVIPITGMLITQLTTRTLFTFAVTSFLAGSVISAIAPSFWILLIGRIIQAVGTAILAPLLMTLTVTVVPWTIRGRIMGRIAVVMSLAPAIGPTVSGLILSSLSWRWMFIIMVPIGGAVLALGLWKLRNVGVTKRAHIDVVSVILSVIGFGGIVYGLNLIGEGATHETPVSPALPLLVGLVSIALFVWRQIRLITSSKQPLLDLRVFGSYPYALATVLFMMTMVALFGVVILLPIFGTNVLHLSTLTIGLIMLPGGILQAILGPIVGRIVDAKGARFILIPGMISMACAMWLFSQVDADTTTWYLLAGHLLMSLGLSGTFTPLFSASLGSLRPELASHGSATISTLQQVAGGVGTAVAISVMALGSSHAMNNGVTDPADTLSSGVQFSFFVGAIVATCSIFVALLMKEKPYRGDDLDIITD